MLFFFHVSSILTLVLTRGGGHCDHPTDFFPVALKRRKITQKASRMQANKKQTKNYNKSRRLFIIQTIIVSVFQSFVQQICHAKHSILTMRKHIRPKFLFSGNTNEMCYPIHHRYYSLPKIGSDTFRLVSSI